jgi:hypothetical protein
MVCNLLKSFFPKSSLVLYEVVGSEPTTSFAFMRPTQSGVFGKALVIHAWSSGSRARYYLNSNLPDVGDYKSNGYYGSDHKSLVERGAIPRDIDMGKGGL